MESEKDNRTGDQGAERYRFGNVVVDALAHTICRDQQPVAVEPKAFAVLLVLLRRPDQLIPRDELLDAVWGHRHVTPGVLTRAITQLRAALADDPHQPLYIQTQHALGYRFIGVLADDPVPPVARTSAADSSTAGEAPVHAAPMINASKDEVLTSAGASAARTIAPPIDMPYAGDERRDDHRVWHWRWLIFAGALIAALSWAWFARQSGPRPVEASIAVLPFTSLSDDRQDRYFAEGLAAEMLSALASEPGITVAAWQSPQAVDRRMDTQALGRKLGVATVLDASVRREGSRLRINARLSDVASGMTLWSQSYNRDANAIFDTQAEIAREVATALIGVLPDAGEGLRRRLAPTRNLAAFDAYLLGISQLLGSVAAKPGDAAQSFQRALASDKGFARAQSGLCRVELWSYEANRDPKAFERARLACLRAENMDRGMGEVRLALGDLYRSKGDLQRATSYYNDLRDDPALRSAALAGLARIDIERKLPDKAMEKFDQSLVARPGDADIYAEKGYQQYLAGRMPDAIATYKRVVALRPDSAEYWSIYGSLLQSAGEDAAADEALKRSLAIEPTEAVLSNLGTSRYRQADYAGAAALYRRAIELNPDNFMIKGFLGDALLADPATATQAKAMFSQAAEQAQSYVRMKADDAASLAELAWYLANLGNFEQARILVERSEKLGPEIPEVSMRNAETLAVMGELEGAQARLAKARSAGIAEVRVATSAVLRAHGLANSAPENSEPGFISRE